MSDVGVAQGVTLQRLLLIARRLERETVLTSELLEICGSRRNMTRDLARLRAAGEDVRYHRMAKGYHTRKKPSVMAIAKSPRAKSAVPIASRPPEIRDAWSRLKFA